MEICKLKISVLLEIENKCALPQPKNFVVYIITHHAKKNIAPEKDVESLQPPSHRNENVVAGADRLFFENITMLPEGSQK